MQHTVNTADTAAHCCTIAFGEHQQAMSQDTAQMQHAATRCNTLQLAATRCNSLQHAVTQLPVESMNSRFFNAVQHCNTLQHIATHCNKPV